MRDRLMTVGVVTAVAAVWAIGLGLVDRAAPRADHVSFEASPSARLERRPALFVIAHDSGISTLGQPGSLPARAVPIAIVEPSGELRAPVPGESEARGTALRTFADTYFQPGSLIRILQGGAAAGSMRIVDATDREGPLPVGRGACEGPDLSAMAPTVGDETVLLGVSDPRLSAPKTGVAPLRSADRAVVSQLLRRLVAGTYPDAHVESVDAVRIRAVDLDRDGRRELVAWGLCRIRTNAKQHADVGCFLLAEPQDDNASSYRAAFSLVGDRPEGSRCLYSYVDQVNLSAAPYDEVVVGCAKDGRHFLVLRRGGDGWREAYRSQVVGR
jgi:hypothetical protein